MEIKPIAHIRSPYTDKFGIPRQSGIVTNIESTIVFEPEYREPEALREIETFEYLWIIWHFSAVPAGQWSPTVRPPRLGGNRRVGVFASRSPFRPNAIGLSAVRLHSVEWNTSKGPILHVEGADLLDGTPIFDIKPYIAYADAHPEAQSGFAQETPKEKLKVQIDQYLLERIPAKHRETIVQILSLDPRPSYHKDGNRVYGFRFDTKEIKFKVDGNVLTVVEVG